MKTIPVNRFPEIPEKELRRDADAAAWLASRIDESVHFERLSHRPSNAIWFRFAPEGRSGEELDAINQSLLQSVNDRGEVRLADGLLDGRLALRLAVSGPSMHGEHVRRAWEIVTDHAERIRREQQGSE
jgi:aromatic-L-amino-acid decarboxylase